MLNTKYRTIATEIPVPESLPIFEKLEEYEARSMHGQLPVVWDNADDFQVCDKWGNRWIDFTSGIFVASSGHSNPYVSKAIIEQVLNGLLYSYTFATEIRAQFLEKLIKFIPSQFEKAFLLSSGTEATECAIKLIRMKGQSINPDKNIIISFRGAMHGRTMGAEMLRGIETWMGFKDPNIYHLQIPFPWEHDTISHILIDDNPHGLNESNIAGFILESYIGWTAFFYPEEYIRKLCAFAKTINAVVCFDEIQSGFGRTGKLFAYEHYGVEPDMICIGKSIGGGFPLSAVLSSREIMDIPERGSMSSTYSANPISCAAGLANLRYMEEHNLVFESERKGKILHSRLLEIQKRFPRHIKYIFGRGLLAGIIFPDTMTADIICNRAMRSGLLLVHTGRESIKIGPPLTIADEALLEGLDVLEESLREL